METLWLSGLLRRGLCPAGCCSSASGSPWRRHGVQPGAVCVVKRKERGVLLCYITSSNPIIRHSALWVMTSFITGIWLQTVTSLNANSLTFQHKLASGTFIIRAGGDNYRMFSLMNSYWLCQTYLCNWGTRAEVCVCVCVFPFRPFRLKKDKLKLSGQMFADIKNRSYYILLELASNLAKMVIACFGYFLCPDQG